jgi:hypothetical protein
VDLLHIDCEGFLLFFALNARDSPVSVTARASAKVMSVRCGEGILKDDPALALQSPFKEQIEDLKRSTPPSSGVRFEAKWKIYGTCATLPPQSQRLLLVMSPRGYQSHGGRVSFTACELSHQPPQMQLSIRTWLGGAGGGSDPTCIFDSQPLDKGWDVARREVNDGMAAAVEQSIIQAAIEQSKAEDHLLRVMEQAQEEEEARQLHAALALSRQEDRELQTVIERSRLFHATSAQPIVEILSSDDESDVQVVSSRGHEVNASSLYELGFAKGVAYFFYFN